MTFLRSPVSIAVSPGQGGLRPGLPTWTAYGQANVTVNRDNSLPYVCCPVFASSSYPHSGQRAELNP